MKSLIQVVNTKKICKHCNLCLFRTKRAKLVTSFLMVYALGTIFFIRQYIFNKSDLNTQFCDNKNAKSLLAERANFDKSLYQSLDNRTTLSSEEGNNFIVAHDHIFLYSAYLDDKKPPLELKTKYYVKIVSIVLQSLNQHYLPEPKCNLKYKDQTRSNVSAYIVRLPEDHKCCYSAAFIFCPIYKASIPTHVSVTVGKYMPQWLEVQSLITQTIPNQEIAICVRPLYGEEFSIVQLAEFITYHHIMGVKHFQFYNATAPVQVKTFLTLLQKEEEIKISLLQWTVPVKDLLVHELGQLAFIQDCILRWQTVVQYVAILDLDELLMPQRSQHLGTAVKDLKRDYPTASAFIFPSILFCEEYYPSPSNESGLMPFISLLTEKRQITPWPHNIRSKYIVIPRRVSIAGIHFIWNSVDPYKPVNIPASEVLIYHYRRCCHAQQPWFFGLLLFSVFSDLIQIDKKVTEMENLFPKSGIHKLLKELV